MEELKKQKLVDFIAKVMEDSGFKVYKDFRTSQHIVDIYGILPTALGDIGVVVACKNYDENWKVGMDVLKEMEMAAKTLKASKVVIVTTSDFSSQARNYAVKRNMKLIDRKGLIRIAEDFSKKIQVPEEEDEEYPEEEEVEVYTPPSNIFHTAPQRGVLSRRESRKPLAPVIRGLMQNTIILILTVVAVSFIIATLLQLAAGLGTSLTGVLKLMIAAALSYGIPYLVEEDGAVIMIKGTIVFFSSLLLLVILILI
ncbi:MULTISPECIES: restriction endonuclease [Methanothermobacter]|uniref:restriction endonuclease n=1 Tax=Methanothermobacter TaxID=145260 RepID=UPI0022B9ADF2|nr:MULTISPECIES: restriction endonuclease [Methanothermobacter]HOQ18610.1 restriction endonuclease [Methanothermobacter thermautotrophicus]